MGHALSVDSRIADESDAGCLCSYRSKPTDNGKSQAEVNMYIEQFKNNEDIAEQYTRGDDEQKAKILKLLNESKVHIAWYGCGSYNGDSFVIFEHNGKLFEASGSHCSCYGLEGQWDPEETDWKALKMRHISEDYDEGHTAREYLHKLCDEHLTKTD